jgi:flagellar hook-length control protein FliK
MERAFPGLEAAAAGRGEEAAGERPGKRAAVVDALGSRRNQEAGSPSLTAWQSAGAARPGLVDALRERDESREPGRLAEARSRKHKAPAGGAGAEEAGERLAPAGGPQSGPQGEAASFTSHRGTESEILVDLKLNGGNPQNSAPAEAAGGAPSGAPSFESALAREIEGNLGYNILREAQIIARSGGEGTIKLSLKPETLGNVKIRLEMAENKITGRILVESPEALRAFSRELPVLEQSFRDSGFNGASLELSLAQEGAGGQESGGQNGGDGNGADGNGAGSRYFPDFAAAGYEGERSGEAPQFMPGAYGFQAGGVNLWI